MSVDIVAVYGNGCRTYVLPDLYLHKYRRISKNPINLHTMIYVQNRRLFFILLSAFALLLVPFIAMQFTEEVHWTLFDFSVAATLLLSAGLCLELAIRKTPKLTYRILACTAIVLMLLLVWIEVAVGIFGTPFAGS